MISTIGEIFNLNHLDQSSRANDVIVIRHRDGSLHSTPFNVRFGRAKLWNSANKVVQVEVNGVLTSAVMKIGDHGEAYWLEPNYGPVHDVAPAPLSPAGAAPSGPVTSLGPPETRREVLQTFLDTPMDLVDETGRPIDIHEAFPAQPESPIDYAAVRGLPMDSSPTDASAVVPLEAPRPASAALAGETPLLQASLDGHLQVSRDAIRTAEDAQEATLALQAMAAAALSRKRLSRFMTSDDAYLRESALAVEAETPPLPPPPTVSSAAVAVAVVDEAPGATSPSHSATSTLSGGRGRGPNSTEDVYSLEPLDGDDLREEAAGEAAPISPNASETSLEGSAGAAPPPAAAEAVGAPSPYFTRTLIPTPADLRKLHLREGCNTVRYLTRKNFQEMPVVVECSIFLWSDADRVVVSDVDGTITRSDLWGHLYAMIGKGAEWTHPGICSLYAKIAANGYRMVYLTARSVTQIEQTKKYLWTLAQDGVGLLLGPVLTAPQRFFTALTKEVSKQSHVFKIACLTSLLGAFPAHAKPFFAGFGNRHNDVISYDAVGIPTHRIFIIDPSSVLHVCRVRQTYRNLAHLVDLTFPPVPPPRRRGGYRAAPAPGPLGASLPPSEVDSVASVESARSSGSDGVGAGSGGEEEEEEERRAATSAPAPVRSATFVLGPHPDVAAGGGGGGGGRPARVLHVPSEEDVTVDADFGSFAYWRTDPRDLLCPVRRTGIPARATASSGTASSASASHLTEASGGLAGSSAAGPSPTRGGEKESASSGPAETTARPSRRESRTGAPEEAWSSEKKKSGFFSFAFRSRPPLSPASPLEDAFLVASRGRARMHPDLLVYESAIVPAELPAVTVEHAPGGSPPTTTTTNRTAAEEDASPTAPRGTSDP